MRSSRLLLQLMANNQIIKNINIPSCKNCIYFEPNSYDKDFTSGLGKCLKFGEKNIITDVITYKYADLCRKDDTKCGEDGIYFEKEHNIKLKILNHKLANNKWLIILSVIFLFRLGFLIK